MERNSKPPVNKSAATVVEEARQAFRTGKSLPLDFRRKQLEAILRLFDEKKTELLEAVQADLQKPAYEAAIYDIGWIKDEVTHFLNNLDDLAAPRKRFPGVLHMTNSTYVQPEPFGVVLVIGCWNFPYMLTIGPAVSAIAAGNAVILKPSEHAPHTSAVMAKLMPQYLDKTMCHVVEGEAEVTQALLHQNLDYVFYTGSNATGKKIYSALGDQLTPCTLELGGKNPVYVGPSADLGLTGRKLVWGRMFNAGQACVCPEYVLCHKDVKEKLITSMRKAYDEMFDGDSLDPDRCQPMVSEYHYKHVRSLMGSGRAVIGGRYDDTRLAIELSVYDDVTPDDPIMQQEVFGPLLSIVGVCDVDEAIDFINARHKPLCLYMFTYDKREQKAILQRTSSGGVSINDCIKQAAVRCLPFGGVGGSGMNGSYHGDHGFNTLSHMKAVFNLGPPLEFVHNQLIYPPYNERKQNFFLALFSERRSWGILRLLSKLPILVAMAAVGYALWRTFVMNNESSLFEMFGR